MVRTGRRPNPPNIFTGIADLPNAACAGRDAARTFVEAFFEGGPAKAWTR
jgi:hypothetical protein